MDALREVAPAYLELQHAAQQHFADNLVFAFISGSTLYSPTTHAKSDIDVTVVLADNISHSEKCPSISQFVKDYVSIHLNHGLQPDINFPGEYVTVSQMNDATAGRGFHVQESQLALPPLYPGYFEESLEHSYRVWLSMMAFSFFLTGNVELYLSAKISALKTVVLYMLSKTDNETTSVHEIIQQLLANKNPGQEFGVTTDYQRIEQHDDHFLHLVFEQLQQSGFLRPISPDSFCIDKNAVRTWSSDLAQRINSQQTQIASTLLSQNEQTELATHAQTIFESVKKETL